ncbi:MAG: redoxin family protein, partial [Phycisphaerae bacterium]
MKAKRNKESNIVAGKLDRSGGAVHSNGSVLRPSSLFAVVLGLVICLQAAPVTAKPVKANKRPEKVRLPDNKTKLEQETPKTPQEGPKPKIVIPEPVHDFGETWMGPKLTHTFVIKNEGDAPLHIERVKPACGCTLAGAHPKVIQPGGSGEFPFSINSKKLRGKYEKSISVQTDDPITPTVRLKLRGVCNRYVDVVPTNANFGKVAFDEPHKRVLKITNNTDKPLELELDKTEEGEFKFKIVEKIPGKNYELHVSMEPPYKAGRQQARLVLKTNFEQQSEIRTAASATIPNRLDVQPPTVTLGITRVDKAYKRPIRFYNYGKNSVKVLEATCDDPAVGLEVQERSAGRSYIITLDIPKGYMPPPTGRTITIKTDDQEQPFVKVPLLPPPQQQARAKTRPQKRPAELLVGQPAPDFVLATTAGKPLGGQSFKDHVTVLDFFAPNCGFCKKQIPRLEAIRKEYEPKGVRFVALSQTMRKPFTDAQVKAKIAELGFQGELAINHNNSVGQLFKAMSFPTMVIVGKTGKVDAVNVGNVADLETRLKGQLDALLAGKPVPAPEKSAAADSPAKRPKRPAEQLVGTVAPAFSFETMDGRKMSKDDLAKGPATVLNFVAPNCGFCKKQVPRLEKLRKSYQAKGVRFINVAETMRKKFTPQETADIFSKIGSNLELAYDGDNKVGPLFKANSFPTMVVLGKSGKVEAVNIGNIADLETRVKGQLDALIAGKPVPTVETTAAATPNTKPKPKARPVDELVGKPAPAFSFDTMKGKKLSNAELRKHPATILNFVAPNCGFCKKQVPRLDKLRAEYEAKGVQFVNVAQTMRKKYTPEEAAEVFNKLGSKIELAYDGDNKIGQLFRASGFPTMVVLGKDGKVQAVNVGNVGDLETRVKGQLDALIAGRPVPTVKAAARPPAARVRPDERIGKPAPAFRFITLDGKQVSNASLDKQPATVINLVAPNCGFCKKQVPRIEKLRQAYEEKGIRFINVVQTMRTKYTPENAAKVFADLGSKMEIAYDGDNKVGSAFGGGGFPTMIVLGKSGKVEAVNVGNIGDLEERLKGQLDSLIAGKPIPQKYIAKQSRRRRPAEGMVGKAAPQFSLTTLEGKRVGNEEFSKYKATVLNFVAPNCGFCKKQIPTVEKIRKEYASRGVRFVNIAQKMRKEYTVEEATKVFEGVGSNLELATDFTN